MKLSKNGSSAEAGSKSARGFQALMISGAMLAVLTVAIPTFAGGPGDVPSISAGLGTCTADFTVVDAASKPIYDAKIHVKVQYGFMSKRNTDLEVGTNANGKAQVVGLPNKLKKPPLEFLVQSGDQSKSVTADPATECHPQFAVTLGK